MKLVYAPAPWVDSIPSVEMLEAADVVARSVWRDAAVEFWATREARLAARRSTPKGVQPFLNRVLDARFGEAGWEGSDGRYRSETTWVRITFRHQMSLGSDIIDALRLVRKDGVRQAAICAATAAFLRQVSPNDAAVLTSYEKLVGQVSALAGVLDIPLFVGRLTPMSPIPEEVARALERPRPRGHHAAAADR